MTWLRIILLVTISTQLFSQTFHVSQDTVYVFERADTLSKILNKFNYCHSLNQVTKISEVYSQVRYVYEKDTITGFVLSDAITIGTCSKTGKALGLLPDETVNFLLDREFSRIVGRSSYIGNFASLDFKDAEVAFAGNIKMGKGSNLGITSSGGATEGLQPLLNGEDVSSNIKVGFQLNLRIFRDTYKINGDATLALNVQNSIDSLWRTHHLQMTTLKEEKLKLSKEKEYEDVLKKIESLKSQKELWKTNEKKFRKKIPLSPSQLQNTFNYRDSLLSIPTPNSITKKRLDSLNQILLNKFYTETGKVKLSTEELSIKKYKIDSLENELQLLNLKLSHIKEDIKSYSKQSAIKRQNLRQKTAAASKKFRSKLELTGNRLNWLSVIFNFQNRSFTLFEEAAAFENQLSSISENMLDIGIAYNIYNISRKRFGTYYFSISLLHSNTDNFDELTSKKILDRNVITTTPVSRTSDRERTVYTGDYNDDETRIKLRPNLYWFLNKNKSFALHIQPEWFLYDDIANLELGLLIPFTDSKKKKSIINAELFYQMIDINRDDAETDEKLSDRSSLGIRFTAPIVFKPNFK